MFNITNIFEKIFINNLFVCFNIYFYLCIQEVFAMVNICNHNVFISINIFEQKVFVIINKRSKR